MGLRTNTLLQLNLSQPDQIQTITLQSKKPDISIYRIFHDPTGKHLLVTTEGGENFYAYDGWTKARPLQKIKTVVESVAWSPLVPSSSGSKTSTREILLGGRNGTIYEAVLDAHEDMFKSQDRYLQPVFALPDRQPVTGIHIELAPGAKKAFIIATTATRLYQFSGGVDKKGDDLGKLWESVFAPYRDAAPSKLFSALDGLDAQFMLQNSRNCPARYPVRSYTSLQQTRARK